MQAKSTGELSIITFAANFLGGLARIFTSLQEGGGASMARAYIIGTEQPLALPRVLPLARHALLVQARTPRRLSWELCVRRSIAPQRHHRAADLLLCQEAG